MYIPDRRNFSFWLEIDENEILCLQIYVFVDGKEISTGELLHPHVWNLFFLHCLHTSDAKALGTWLHSASPSSPWWQVSQHSKYISGSYYDLPIAMTLHKGTVSHMSHWTQTKYVPFLSWSRDTDGLSNATPHKRTDTEVGSICGLNFSLFPILKKLKILWTHCYSSSQGLGRNLWNWRCLEFKFHYCH